MGLRDLFRRDTDPVKRLTRMNKRKLREHHAEVELQVEETLQRIQQARREYEGLMERGRETASDHEKRRYANLAKQTRQKITLLERDYEGLLKTEGMTSFLLNNAEQLGTKTAALEGQLRDLMRLSPREMSKALDGLAAQHQKAMGVLSEVDSQVEDYAEPLPEVGNEADELALMREGPVTTEQPAEPGTAVPTEHEPADDTERPKASAKKDTLLES